MKPKNISVIGSGYWGKNLVRNFNDLGALHSICDTNITTLQSLTTQYPTAQGLTRFEDVLNEPEIKGVAIATPAELHASLARQALLANKDVYVEKPLCLSEQDGQELLELAEKQKKILMVGHLLWYHPAIIKLKELIKQGELGRLQYIYSNRLNLGKLRREENVLWSFAPHDISIILGLLGEMPDSVQAQGSNLLHDKIADTTVTLLHFPSGIKAHIFVSWLHPFKEQKLVVVGNKQMAVFDDTVPWNQKLQLFPHSIAWSGNIPVAHKAEAISIELEENEPLKSECNHFLDCIEERNNPKTDAREGLRVLRVLNASQDSLEQSKTIRLTDSGATPAKKTYFHHNTTIIDDNVTIGDKTKIWHFSHILSGSQIGEKCNIGQNAVIGPDVKIGKSCKIQNNISIYKGVTLEDHVFCGPSMVFTNVYNPRCEYPRMDSLKETLVKTGATIGANATIVCGITIGQYAFIGAGAVVTDNVPDFALMVGNPARQTGWMSKFGEKLNLPLTGDGECICPHTNTTYTLREGSLSALTDNKTE